MWTRIMTHQMARVWKHWVFHPVASHQGRASYGMCWVAVYLGAAKCSACPVFYYAQVSIAGQPGGVEAARVKIRVSGDSRDFNLTRGDGQAENTKACGFAAVRLWVLRNIFLTSHDDLIVTLTSLASNRDYLLYFISICLCFSSGLQKRIVFVWIREQMVCFLFANICISNIFNCVQTFCPLRRFHCLRRIKQLSERVYGRTLCSCKCWQALKSTLAA